MPKGQIPGQSIGSLNATAVNAAQALLQELEASRNETLRQMSVTLLGLSDESLNAVLSPSCRLRQLEGLPSPD